MSERIEVKLVENDQCREHDGNEVSADNVFPGTQLLNSLKAEVAVSEIGVMAKLSNVVVVTPVVKEASQTPPPPPPPTPVNGKLTAEKATVTNELSKVSTGDVVKLSSQGAEEEIHGDHIKKIVNAPSHSPVISKEEVQNNEAQCNVKMAVELKTALEAAIAEIDAAEKSHKRSQRDYEEMEEEIKRVENAYIKLYNVEVKSLAAELQESELQEQAQAHKQDEPLNSTTEQQQMELLEAMDTLSELQTTSPCKNKYDFEVNLHQGPTIIEEVNQNDDGDMPSLQVLPARSSTPYLQPTSSCTVVNCDHVSPVKDEEHEELNNIVLSINAKKNTNILNNDYAKNNNNNNNINLMHYTYDNLMAIRDAMPNLELFSKDKNNNYYDREQQLANYLPHIVNCHAIELEARLRHLNILKYDNRDLSSSIANNTAATSCSSSSSSNGNNNISNNGNSNSNWNDMMPAFYKRKNINSNEYNAKNNINMQQNKSKDSSIVNGFNNRRIGSGRLQQQNQYKWHNGPNEFYGTRQVATKTTTTRTTTEQQQENDNIGVVEESNKNNSHRNNLRTANDNYVKRVRSGFLVVSNPKSRNNAEEHYAEKRYQNNTEEPEWFSCGPSSRLDTIELCGFEGNSSSCSSETEAHESKEDNSKESNTNANVENNIKSTINKSEKKTLSFQFDKFSQSNRHNNNNNNNHNHNYHNNNQNNHRHGNNSRFMPLFNDANTNIANNRNNSNGFPQTQEEEKGSGSNSLNEFFMHAMQQNNNNNNKSTSTIPHITTPLIISRNINNKSIYKYIKKKLMAMVYNL